MNLKPRGVRHAIGCCMAVLVGATFSHAQTVVEWKPIAVGFWYVPTNWVGDMLPGTNDIADTGTANGTNTLTFAPTATGFTETVYGLMVRTGDTVKTTGTAANEGAAVQVLNVLTILTNGGTIRIFSSNTNNRDRKLRYFGTNMVNSGTIALASAGGPGRNADLDLLATNAHHVNTGTIIINGTTTLGRVYVGSNTVFENRGTVEIGVHGAGRPVTHDGLFQLVGFSEYRQTDGLTWVGNTPGSWARLDASMTSRINIEGGTVKGTGTVTGQTRIASAAVVAPGDGIGRLKFSGHLTFDPGSRYEWEIGALSTNNPGVNFDVIELTASNLTINGGMLVPRFVGPASPPDQGDPFWRSDNAWVVIDNTGPGTTAGALAVSNSPSWSAWGTFYSTNVGNDVYLIWDSSVRPGAVFLIQ